MNKYYFFRFLFIVYVVLGRHFHLVYFLQQISCFHFFYAISLYMLSPVFILLYPFDVEKLSVLTVILLLTFFHMVWEAVIAILSSVGRNHKINLNSKLNQYEHEIWLHPYTGIM